MVLRVVSRSITALFLGATATLADNDEATHRQITTSDAEIMAACPQLSTVDLINVEFPRSNGEGLDGVKLTLRGHVDDSDTFTIPINGFTTQLQNPSPDREAYIINIQSLGGDARIFHPLIDTIRQSDDPVYTYASFNAQSGAFSLLISGTPDLRWALTGITLMTHTATFTDLNGNQYDAEDFAEGTADRRIMDSYNQYMGDLIIESSVTNIPEECALALVQPDTNVFLSNAAALQLGLIDYVIDWSTETALTRAPH